MSELIAYDADALVAAAERAQKLKNSVEDTRSQLESLYGQLVSATSALTAVPGGVSDSSVATLVSKKKLRVQAAKLESLVSVLNEAAGLTDTATKNVEEVLDAFGLAISALQSAAVPVAVMGTAIADTFGHLFYDTRTSVKEILKKISSPSITPEQILANAAARNAAIMEIFESSKSGYLGRGRLLDDGKINCMYFTWRKIEQLLGSNCTKNIRTSAKMRDLSGKTVTADDGTEYLITTYDATKASELVNSISQPAENIVLSFNGHLMMIDRIQDNIVYFSDNSDSSWNTYRETGVFPTQVMSLEEFGTYYDEHNRDLNADAYSLTKK